MKFLALTFFFFRFHAVSAQEANRKFFPDTLLSVQMTTAFQKEDLYSFVGIQLPVSKSLFFDFGLGGSWRRGLSSAVSLAYQGSLHYNFSKRPKLFLGPSFRIFQEFLKPSKQSLYFSFTGAEMGYRFGFGERWKVIQASYLGFHTMNYKSVTGRDQVNYLGYSIQLGVSYTLKRK